MNSIDSFSSNLLEESLRFYEKSKEEVSSEGKKAFRHSAIIMGFCAMEAHLNSIADDFSQRQDLSLLEKSLLLEKRIDFINGSYSLSNELKIFRYEDRIEYLYKKFSKKNLNKNTNWWGSFQNAIDLRNKLTHPKDVCHITDKQVKNSLESILKLLNVLYTAIYKTPYPKYNKGLQSNLNF